MLYLELCSEKGLNPSVASPSLMFLGSFAKSGYTRSKSCHASPSAGWLISFSLGCRFNLCHCACSYASLVANILFSLGANGKCRNTFCGIFFLSGSFHLERSQTGQLLWLAYSFLTTHNYCSRHVLNHIQDLVPLQGSLLHHMILGVYCIPGMLQPIASLLLKKPNCLSYRKTSYEEALPQRRTLKIWYNPDTIDVLPPS